MKRFFLVLGLGSIVFTIAGCSAGENVGSNQGAARLNNAPYLLASEPESSLGVKSARESVKDQEEIVVVGRIGGSLNPWVEKRAAFQIVDPSLPSCSDCKEGESCSCKTPWDYCCETDKLPNAMALVQFADEKGNVLKEDARSLFGLVELQTVVIQGVAKRDEAGNLTIMADKMFVKK